MNKSLMVGLISIALLSSPVTAMADQHGWGNYQGSHQYSPQRSSAPQWNDHNERNNHNDWNNRNQRNNHNDWNNHNAYQWNNRSPSDWGSPPRYNYGGRYNQRVIYSVGGRLPDHYRTQYYYVSNWRGYNLQPPPYGYGWVNVDGDFILVALATGVIAQVLLNNGY